MIHHPFSVAYLAHESVIAQFLLAQIFCFVLTIKLRLVITPYAVHLIVSIVSWQILVRHADDVVHLEYTVKRFLASYPKQ